MKKLLTLLFVFLLVTALAVSAAAAEYLPHLVDEADLLTPDQEAELETKLAGLSEKWSMDFVVVTADDLGGASSTAYADDFYDYSGYDKNGILWLIDMDNRKSTLSTSGNGITVFTDAGQDYIQDRLSPMLTEEKYAEGIEAYITLCDDFCRQAKEGAPYDVDNLPKEPFDMVLSVFIAVFAAIIVASVGGGILKGQLKSVHAKAEAADYMKPGSLQLTEARDFFLYRHIDRREKPKNDGGSTTHTSSSGSTHGGSSRSF